MSLCKGFLIFKGIVGESAIDVIFSLILNIGSFVSLQNTRV